jgi:hypothetical protein
MGRGGFQLSSASPRRGACHAEPFAVTLSPSLVILSEAKNLQFPPRVNSAKGLQYSLRLNSAKHLQKFQAMGTKQILRFAQNDNYWMFHFLP